VSRSGTGDATERLAAEAAATRARLVGLQADFAGVVAASSDSNADDEHDPEGSTIAFERSQIAALINQAQQHLAEVEAAEDRLAQGRYGVCEVCGRAIAPARLEARPVARLCIECAAGGSSR
jgi:DnaK suppressor protein